MQLLECPVASGRTAAAQSLAKIIAAAPASRCAFSTQLSWHISFRSGVADELQHYLHTSTCVCCCLRLETHAVLMQIVETAWSADAAGRRCRLTRWPARCSTCCVPATRQVGPRTPAVACTRGLCRRDLCMDRVLPLVHYSSSRCGSCCWSKAQSTPIDFLTSSCTTGRLCAGAEAAAWLLGYCATEAVARRTLSEAGAASALMPVRSGTFARTEQCAASHAPAADCRCSLLRAQGNGLAITANPTAGHPQFVG